MQGYKEMSAPVPCYQLLKREYERIHETIYDKAQAFLQSNSKKSSKTVGGPPLSVRL
jgi:hypothetical protein